MPLSSVNSVTLTSYKKLEDTPATNEVGDLKGKSVGSASADSDAVRLATRSEEQQTGSLKNKLLSSLSHLGERIENFFKNRLPSKSTSEKTQSTAAPQAPLSQEQVAKKMAEIGLKLGVDALGAAKLDILAQVSGSELKEQHSELATGNGALRSVATGLKSIEKLGSAEHQAKASQIFSQDVAGIPFQQWATTGSTASKFVQHASADDLQLAAQALNDVAKSIAELAEDVRNFLNPNVDSAALSPQTAIPFESTASRYATDNDLGIDGGRTAKDLGRKTALDAISFLSKSVAPSKQVHISSDTINNLQDAIAANDVNFYQLKNSAVSFGDLQTLRELALSTNPQSSELNAAGNLGATINELSSTRPNFGNILTSVQTFIEESNQAWSEHHEDKHKQFMATNTNPENKYKDNSFDAGLRSKFNEQLIAEQLSQMPTSNMQQAYEQLDGQFGDRMRGIMEFSAAQVGKADISDVMTSEALKYSTVIDGLMDSLNLKLNPASDSDKPLGKPTNVSNIAQLSPLEQAALSRIGITKQILEE
ncbi:hypothetical protein FM037_27745 [Shewanella psychropiezotolerans]|uniref:Virulence factor YopE GAP domain-containing protein n=1 Tax=Shewanella psychropiezotolerans TaxID=2593655 RepID=A0ABX5X4T2_9GAMM|nr:MULTISPECIES: hypothetical protein [Shewanella]MPY25659.1 hypothetical protein [Shewanella sp. YLB-07]QDO86370.1 hypothetical protein FM037_27745 [Shewanella psychropiezotolerans]